MALISTLSVGMGVITSVLIRDLGRARGEIRTFATEITNIKPLLGAIGAGLAGLGVASGLKMAVTQASSLSSALNKTRTIFGDAGGAITAEGDRMAESIGAVKSEYINAAAGFGAVFKSVGKGQEEAAALGNQLAKTAIDLARFNDTADATGFQAITSALKGEFDPIEQFRIFLSADKIAAEALALGLAKSKKEIDENARKMSTLSLVMKGSADAQGAAAREAGEVGSQLSAMGGRAKNLAADFGLAIEPLTSKILGLGGGALGALGEAFTQNRASLEAWATGAAAGVDSFVSTLTTGFGAIGARLAEFPGFVAEALDPSTLGSIGTFADALSSGIGSAVELAGIAFRNLPDFLDVAALQMTEKVINIGEVFSTVPANAAIVGEYLRNEWPNLVADGLNLAWTAWDNFATNVFAIGGEIRDFLASGFTDPIQFDFTPLLQGFEATAAKLPEMVRPHLTSLQGEIDAKLKAIGEREAGRLEIKPAVDMTAVQKAAEERKAALAGPVAAEKVIPDSFLGLAEAGKGGEGKGGLRSTAADLEPKVAGALELGSAEARSAVLKFQQRGLELGSGGMELGSASTGGGAVSKDIGARGVEGKGLGELLKVAGQQLKELQQIARQTNGSGNPTVTLKAYNF